jgi:hypothetical protein
VNSVRVGLNQKTNVKGQAASEEEIKKSKCMHLGFRDRVNRIVDRLDTGKNKVEM